MSSSEDVLSPCAQIVRAQDPDRFRAALWAPPAYAEGVLALYAFNMEVARLPLVAQESLIAQMRYQFWREAAAGLTRTTRCDLAGHPAAEALWSAAQTSGRAEALGAILTALVDAREAVHAAPLETIAAAETFFERTGGGLAEAAALLCGAPEAAEAAAALGTAHGAANALLAFGPMAAQGRILAPPAVGEPPLTPAAAASDPGRRAAAALGALGAGYWRDGVRLWRALPRRIRLRAAPVWVGAWDVPRLLRAARRPSLDPMRDLSARSEFMRQAGPLWRRAWV